MGQCFAIHPDNPQQRLISQVAKKIRQGALVVFPTDSSYALGCHLGDKDAVEKIRQLRHLDKDHNFTLVCRNLSELGMYARVDNPVFRLLKVATPGPYTFVLPATRDVPKRLQHPKRKTIGMRVPKHPITDALLKELDEPLMSVTLILDEVNDGFPIADIDALPQSFVQQVDVIIDGGHCGIEPTTIVSFVDGHPDILRKGQGSCELFL